MREVAKDTAAKKQSVWPVMKVANLELIEREKTIAMKGKMIRLLRNIQDKLRHALSLGY